jgi:hypothetical protein
MAKKKAAEPAVRKSLLVMGGAAIGAALFGFILLKFVLGGGGGEEADQATELAILNNASIPIASATPGPGSDGAVSNVLTPGGRDPFVKPDGVATISTNPGGLGSTSSAPVSSGSTPVAAPAAAPAPTTTYVEPAPQPVPVGEGPAPAPQQPAPTATPRPTFEQQTITVLAIYNSSADVRIDDIVYEGARANDVLTERFKLDEFEGSCFWMKDRYPPDSQKAERFKLCADDTATR